MAWLFHDELDPASVSNIPVRKLLETAADVVAVDVVAVTWLNDEDLARVLDIVSGAEWDPAQVKAEEAA